MPLDRRRRRQNQSQCGRLNRASAANDITAEVSLYGPDQQPDADDKTFLDALNPDRLKVVTAHVEPSPDAAETAQKLQFERHGYFVGDRKDHGMGRRVVFNRVKRLKDSWGK